MSPTDSGQRLQPMRQHTSLFKCLEVVEVMRTFVTQQTVGSEELCSRLAQVEGDLATAQKATEDGAEWLRKWEEEMEATKVEVHRLKDEGETVETKCRKTKQ